jgi:hypothetical protein
MISCESVPDQSYRTDPLRRLMTHTKGMNSRNATPSYEVVTGEKARIPMTFSLEAACSMNSLN